MISEKMKPYVKNNSAIRMMFEEGNRLRAKYGADKVFDFSLGNPSVPAPDSVREAIIDLVNNTDPTVLHGYMSNAGFEDVRQTIAESLNRRFDTKFSAKNLIMTVGAASGLNVILKTILNPGEEVIVFAPYFLEYGAYVRNYDGVLVEISPDTTTFQPNLAEFEQKITPKKSEAGIEYIREMRLAGLIKRDIIPADEAVGYEELEKNGSLPDGVYATYENGKRSYCRVESTVPDMTGEEIDRLIQLRKASDLRTIKNWILFFGVMAVIGLCLGGISLFVR